MKKLLTIIGSLFGCNRSGEGPPHVGNARERNALLPIASINATVLGLVIALLLGYATYSYTIISKLEFDALHEAERINKVYFAKSVYLPEYEFKLPSVKRDYIDLFTTVCLLLTADTKSLPPYTQKHYGLPTEPITRARKALSILNILGHRYPFPESISITNTWATHSPKPIYFTDYGALRKWKSDLDEFIQSSGCFRSIALTELPSSSDVLRALTESEKKLIEKSRTNRILQSMGSAEPGYLIEDFLRSLELAYDISQSVGYRIGLADQYKEKSFPGRTVLFIIFFAGFVFLSGVILPMLNANLHKFFYIYFPVVFYILLLVSAIWWISHII